jgi:hypothetical protein
MYRLVLQAPFGVVIIHRKRFPNQQEALDASETLPFGFEAVPESMAPAANLLVPIRIKQMKTEDIMRYDSAREDPFQVEEEVYIPAWDTVGSITNVDGYTLTVKFGNIESVMGVADVIRLEKK